MTIDRANDLARMIKELVESITEDKPGSLQTQADIEEFTEAAIKHIKLIEMWNKCE